jgi:hypothetical protein
MPCRLTKAGAEARHQMKRIDILVRLVLCCIAISVLAGDPALAQTAESPVVVFSEPGFPAADSAAPSQAQMGWLVPNARIANEEQLGRSLAEPATRLLILPYDSAYPEAEWPDIYAFLTRGGNLIVLGGRPFTRAAFKDSSGWHLRDYSVRDSHELFIDQYQTTPGSEGLEFETNPDAMLQLTRFSWKHAFSPILHLTSSDVYARDGSAGTVEARIDAFAWGTQDGRKISAPAIQIDHIRNRFAGGRWIFLNAELGEGFFGSVAAKNLVLGFVDMALRGSEEFIVRPALPLYLPGEPVELETSWVAAGKPGTNLTAQITVTPEQRPSEKTVQIVTIPTFEPIVIPAPHGGGLFRIDANLIEGNRTRASYHSGFWIRDEAYLRSGPRFTVNKDYLELDGKPLAVVGTTYMASDVQRLFFDHPNVYVWDSDLAQISGAGLNMIRTGWWSGWDKLCDEEGRPYDRTLRTMEAFLMTARKHGLPVQFNFFAFLPDSLGGVNSYLDPQAVRRQETLISSVAGRFRDVPFVAWDLVNEPSFSKHTWQMRANEDSYELAEWNRWLGANYPDRAALGDMWNLGFVSKDGALPVPTEDEFAERGMYAGHNSLKLYDFFEFAQETFAGWVKKMRETIRATGSQQPITVGQDEGGIDDRLSPAFYGASVDFTSMHNWWNNDSLLWDSLAAKQPGLPMLIQETGIQRELTLDQVARRTAVGDAELLERKIALSFVGGSGAIQWLWNSNTYMTNDNEVPIGVVRADGTEKPEGDVMRAFAKFAREAGPSLRNPQTAQVAIVTSQAAQFSAIREMQIRAQRQAVRALTYYDKTPAYMIAENQIAKLGSPRLAILPSAQALNESTWQSLLAYVKAGGNLLITGPIERDAHWHRVERLTGLNVKAKVEPLTVHNVDMSWKGQTIPMTFDLQAQGSLEYVQFDDGQEGQEVLTGNGNIIVAGYPVEMAEGAEAAARLYAQVLKETNVQPLFELKSSVSAGVLIYPTVLDDAVLYVMVSETDQDTDVDLRDKTTGGELKLRLAAGRAALAVMRKLDGTIAAKYGF